MSKRRRKKQRDTEASQPADTNILAATGRAQASGRRRARRIALSVIGPFVLFAVVEIALRVCGYGHPVSFFIRSGNGFIPNDAFGQRFHCPDMPDPFFLPEDKPAGSVRIFVLGESAAHGTPDPAFGVSRILEVMLRDQFPGRTIDVFNCAMMGINSHAIVPIARACAEQKADLLLVYAGNNELIGSYGVDTAWTGMPSPLSQFLIHAALGVRATKTGQWIGLSVGEIAARARQEEIQDVSFYQAHRNAADSSQRTVVRENFRANLEAVCDIARDAKTKLLLSTVAVNLKDCPPFGSLHARGLSAALSNEWEAAYQRGIAAESASQWGAALEAYGSAAVMDDSFADLRFRMGRCLASRGDFAKARDEFLRALDCDAIPFRCDEPLNDTIRDVAAKRGAALVDSERVLENGDADEHQIPGEALFLEHVHFTFHGNYELARALFPAVVLRLMNKLGPDLKAGRPLPDEKACAERLAYTRWDEIKSLRPIAKLIASAPFHGQMDVAQRLARLHSRLEQLEASFQQDGEIPAMQTYVSAMERAPDDWYLHRNLAELMSELDHHDTAAAQFKWVVNRFPQHLTFQLMLAASRIDGGDVAGATRDLENILLRDPMNAGALALSKTAVRRAAEVSAKRAGTEAVNPQAELHGTLGNTLLTKGHVAEAIAEYRKAVAIAPESSLVQNNLGGALFRANAADEAIEHFEKAVKLSPDYGLAQMNLGIALGARRDYADAMAHLRRAVELRAASPAAAAKLALLLASAPDGALRDGADAVRLAEDVCEKTGRKFPLALDALAAAYAETGRFEDAARVATESQAFGGKQAAGLVALYQSGRPLRLPPKDMDGAK